MHINHKSRGPHKDRLRQNFSFPFLTGNDIVTIVFQEPGAAPFTPRNIRSQFQHVFVVVRAIDPCTENTHYSIAVSRAKEVPLFGPPIKEGAVYAKGDAFTDLLLAKVSKLTITWNRFMVVAIIVHLLPGNRR